jgi:hypothetical protein
MRKPIKAMDREGNFSLMGHLCNVSEVRELEAYTTELEQRSEDMRCCGNCKTYECGWCPDREIDIDGTAFCENWQIKEG